MPKERRKRSSGHEPSAKLNKQQSVIQNDILDHKETIAEIPDIANHTTHEKLQDPLTKKGKQQLKREALLQRLGLTQSHSSKSHSRRVKRKMKERVAGDFSDMQAAIIALDNEIPKGVQPTETSVEVSRLQRQKIASSIGKIGEGRNATLSKSQRKRTLRMEQLRHPLILSNPQFTSNPFQTIRTHAQNTLLQHQTTSD